jgi:hypothetical protein
VLIAAVASPASAVESSNQQVTLPSETARRLNHLFFHFVDYALDLVAVSLTT